MIVVDPQGNLFDERRKKNRRKNDEFVSNDRREGEDRRTDEWVKELLDDEEIQEGNLNENQKEPQEEN